MGRNGLKWELKEVVGYPDSFGVTNRFYRGN